jgi:spore cortex formation protein SpoVR/YcgB (stage V sporulation)
VKEFLESQEFYKLMQAYRHSTLLSQTETMRTFEAVKNAILEQLNKTTKPKIHEHRESGVEL